MIQVINSVVVTILKWWWRYAVNNVPVCVYHRTLHGSPDSMSLQLFPSLEHDTSHIASACLCKHVDGQPAASKQDRWRGAFCITVEHDFSHSHSRYLAESETSSLHPLSLILHRTRSEEHTSELQSRPHISYAVFCLKKKKKKTTKQYHHHKKCHDPTKYSDSATSHRYHAINTIQL